MLKKTLALTLFIVIAFSAAACTASNGQTTNQSSTLSGKVIVDGSGTVFPLMAHIAEQYMTKEQPDVDVQVGRAGSSAG
ncbi:MAG: phosphate ABC transporter phosphate-binding protein, partial [Bacillota bacterium]|nr:phosphate ABC transporter phosphate-binding protein [Bacillota bacterium]